MQFYQVQLRAVAFVLAEAILGKTRAEVAHNRVARDFRDDARRRDAEAVAIAVDDCRLREGKRKDRQAIDEHVLGLHRERIDRRAHRLVRRTQNIDRIDFDRIDNADSPQNGVVPSEVVVNLFALLREQLLRIVQPPVAEFFRKDDGGGYDRAGERAAARFIDAGDRRDTEGAKSAFMPETTTTVHRGKIPKR